MTLTQKGWSLQSSLAQTGHGVNIRKAMNGSVTHKDCTVPELCLIEEPLLKDYSLLSPQLQTQFMEEAIR